MKRILLVCLLLCVGVHAYAEQTLTRLAKPIAAPELNLMDLNDHLWTIESLNGKPTIINFWATWCAPCRAEMPSMERAWEQIKDDGIQMLAINYGEDRETIETFLFEFPMSIPVLLDTMVITAKEWPFRALPTTLILDSDGYIVYKAVGPREWDSKALLNEVRMLKKE